MTDRQTYTQTDTQTHRQTDRQTDKHTDTQTDTQTDTHTHRINIDIAPNESNLADFLLCTTSNAILIICLSMRRGLSGGKRSF